MNTYNYLTKTSILCLMIILLLASTSNCSSPLSPDQEGPQTIRYGRKITLKSADVTFSIPNSWLEWNQKFHNNLHLTAKELQDVKDGAGQWDTEFAQVVNRVLPFERCAVHVGETGWGKDGGATSYTDLQVRVYTFKEIPIKEIERLIEREGVAEVEAITGLEGITVKKSTEGPWQRNALDFGLWYDDYGAVASVDFRIRRFKDDTIVVVLMYTKPIEREEEIISIMDSFQEN